MLHLKVLGGCHLESGGRPLHELAGQRRRLALLSAIAVAGPAGVPRERLQALLWPEADDERARRALNQLLYALRRDLDAPLVAGTSTLALDPASLTADVAALDEALRRDDIAQALERYIGPFLDGFALAEVPEFDQWVDGQRARLHRQVLEAGLRAATAATRDGRLAEAEAAWRRLAEIAPLDPRPAAGLIDVLARRGDRVGARQHADLHADTVRRELEAEPDPLVLDAAERARRIAAPVPGSASEAPAPPPIMASQADTSSADSPAPATAPVRPVRAAAGSRLLWPAVLVVLLAVVVSVAVTRRPAPGPRWIVLAELANSSEDSTLGAALAPLMAAELQQAGAVNVVPPARVREALRRMGRPDTLRALPEPLALELAQREGADAVLGGEITRVGRELLVTFRLTDAADGSVLRTASARAREGDALVTGVADALDDVGGALRRRGGGSRRLPLPAATTTSLEALRRYAAGSAAFDRADYRGARDLYTGAVALDSNFALAHAALGTLAYWLNDRPTGDRHFDRALALADRLTPREQALVRARAAGWRGDWRGAAGILRGWLTERPQDQDAWIALGYDLMRADDGQGALEAYAAAARLGPLGANDEVNIATSWKRLARLDSALAAYARAFARDSGLLTRDNLNHEYGGALVLAGRPAEAREAFARMLSRGDGARALGLRSLGWLEAFEGRYDSAQARLEQAATLHRALGQPVSEVRTRLIRAALLAQAGRTRAALDEARALAAATRGLPLEPRLLYWLGRPLARGGDPGAQWLLDSLRARSKPGNPDDRAAELGLAAELAVAAGRAAEGVALLREAAVLDDGAITQEGLGRALVAAGALAEAARLFDSVSVHPEFGHENQLAWVESAYWAGRAHEAAGDYAAARNAYRRYLTRWGRTVPELAYTADATGRLRELTVSADRR